MVVSMSELVLSFLFESSASLVVFFKVLDERRLNAKSTKNYLFRLEMYLSRL